MAQVPTPPLRDRGAEFWLQPVEAIDDSELPDYATALFNLLRKAPSGATTENREDLKRRGFKNTIRHYGEDPNQGLANLHKLRGQEDAESYVVMHIKEPVGMATAMEDLPLYRHPSRMFSPFLSRHLGISELMPEGENNVNLAAWVNKGTAVNVGRVIVHAEIYSRLHEAYPEAWAIEPVGRDYWPDLNIDEALKAAGFKEYGQRDRYDIGDTRWLVPGYSQLYLTTEAVAEMQQAEQPPEA